MAEIFDLFETDANNVDRWPEGMLGGQINNAGRADEGILARWYGDTDGSRTASGSSNAFAVTSARTIGALFNNLTQAFTANHTITGAATLNLNGLGAKTIKRFNGSDLAAGDIVSGQPVLVAYKQSADVWFMLTAPAALVTNMFADFSENASPGNPAADVARLYATDVGGTTKLAYRNSAGVETVLESPARAYAEYTSNADLTTTTPQDDSIPQSSEGNEVLSVSITLKRSTSRVRARFQGFGAFNGAGLDDLQRWIAALFIDSATDAAAAAISGPQLSNQPVTHTTCVLDFEHAPGGVGPFTYKIRVGSNGTMRLNGLAGSRLLGGAARATLIVEEVFV